MFSIDFDKENSLFVVHFEGMMSDDEARRYTAELRSAYVRGIGSRLHYRMLVDLSAASIQPQSVMAILLDHVGGFPRASALGIATGQSLMKMQVRRVLDREYLRYFDRPEDAKAWLLAQPL